MGRRIVALLGSFVVVIAALGVVFVVGMRAKSPLVQNAVRKSGRATKGFVLKSSGTPGGMASIVRHVGRTSGRPYETPVQAVVTDDGFVIALPYGPTTDWVRNIVMHGSATIVHEGATVEVGRPEVVAMDEVALLFTPKDQRTHRLFRVDEALLVRRA